MRYNNVQTPCYIIDTEELEKSVNAFYHALSVNFEKSIVAYSVKTNSTPYILRKIAQMGGYAEVVSHDEYQLAKLCGFPCNRIIYNGPLKSKITFLEAIIKGAIVNIETKRELRWLKELPETEKFSVGIRLNINISKISPDDADGSDDNSRFGFSEDTGEFKDAIAYISKQRNLTLDGIHIHRTAHTRSVRFYERSVKYAAEIIKKYGLDLKYIDIGGGYYGIFPNSPTYQEYSDAFYSTLKSFKLDSLCVIVEPGNGLVASCFTFLTEVVDVKQVEKGLFFVTTDGSRNDIDPFFRKSSYMTEILYGRESKAYKIEPEKQIISGCTCLENDRLFVLHKKPLLQEGDRIAFKNVGAYTMCLSPLFIRYFPRIYATTTTEFCLIRRELKAEDLISNLMM